MLDNLMDIVKGFSQKAVSENASIPDDQKAAASHSLSTSVVEGLKDQVAQGNLTDLFDIFSKKETATGNPALTGIQSSAQAALSQSTGISGGNVSSMVTHVLGMLGKKAGDPNDQGLDFNGLFGSLSGGKLGGIDLNNAMSRLDDDHDGFGLDDVSRLFSGGNILGKLKGLFG